MVRKQLGMGFLRCRRRFTTTGNTAGVLWCHGKDSIDGVISGQFGGQFCSQHSESGSEQFEAGAVEGWNDLGSSMCCKIDYYWCGRLYARLHIYMSYLLPTSMTPVRALRQRIVVL